MFKTPGSHHRRCLKVDAQMQCLQSSGIGRSIIGNQYICPKCGNYFSVPARRRIEMLADEESFKEWDTGLTSGNPLHYKGYEDKVEALREKTGLDEAVTQALQGLVVMKWYWRCVTAIL